jgi:NAD(P)-dependent dehydrogenase (short-subunit alcohol dehydrogenase family)
VAEQAAAYDVLVTALVSVAPFGSLLTGNRAVVTGGASGIGRATCRRFAAEGARVAVCDVDVEGAKAVAAEIGGLAYSVDVREAEMVQTAVDAAVAELGGLDIIFNNAGVGSMSPLHDYDVKEFDRVVSINLHGVWHGIRAAAPHLIANGRGRIINTSSISGLRPSAGEGPYAASKLGVVALTATAALEYAEHGITVNAVAPGMVRSALTVPLLSMPGWEDKQVARTPLGRIGEPEDIADVVAFLASDMGRFVTGQVLTIDGGMTLHGAGVDGILDYVKELMRG